MSTQDMEAGPRRATNVTLPAALVTEAKERGINVSQACEAGLRASVAELRRTQWLAENRAAIEEYNRRIESEGLTLAAFRPF